MSKRVINKSLEERRKRRRQKYPMQYKKDKA